MDDIELNDLDNHHEEEEEEDKETDFNGLDENDILNNLDWLSNRGREVIDINHMDSLKKLFGDRVNEARNIGFLFEDKLLLLQECANPRFIKYLVETKDFTIKDHICIRIRYQL